MRSVMPCRIKRGMSRIKFVPPLLLPANIGSEIRSNSAIVGFMMQSMFGDVLVNVGISFFGAAVLFYLVTLPVEFNASHRAMTLISQTGILTNDEDGGCP